MNAPIDAAQRLDALDPTRSFCVTAPAGSGKTELLSQRVLALLARAEQPEEILAITFTRKAAAEMRERILNALRAAQLSEPVAAHKRQTWQLAAAVLQRDAECGWNLLNNPARLRVQTIDGFCASLTAQMPVLSQFGGQPRVTEQAAPLYRAAIDALLAQLEQHEPIADSLAELLLHVDNRVERLHELLADLLARRDQWLPHLFVGIERGAAIEAGSVRILLEHTLRQVRCDALHKARAHLLIYRGELLPLLDFAAQRLQEENPDHPLVALRGCIDFPECDSAAVERWRGIAEFLLKKDGDWRKQVDKRLGFPPGVGLQKAEFQTRKQSMQALLEALSQHTDLREVLNEILHLPAHDYPDTQWHVLVHLTQVLRHAVAQLQLVFQTHGEVDFTEMSLSALRALGDELDPTELMLRLDYRIRHLLIDEFQDTSATQYRLLERLLEGWAESNESGGAPQTLFIVGDGMQSIYGFREAKVGLFLEARAQGINQLELCDAPLCVNFRSTPSVVEWVNRVFEQAFPHSEHIARGAVPYEPSQAFNDNTPDSEVMVYGMRNDPSRSAEAEQCVQLIQGALASASEGAIAVLVRTRNQLRAIIPALQRAKIAFRATDIDPLRQRSHILDMLSLLKALLNPADRIAWLALLRSPLVGLNNADLHTLIGGVGTGDLKHSVFSRLHDANIVSALGEFAQQRINHLTKILDVGWQQRARKPLRSWLEGIWLALGGNLLITTANARDDVQILLDLIEQRADAFDLTDMEQSLRSLYARADHASQTRVLLMTIHKSKGLEFDTVIVPGLDAGARGDDKPLLRWSEYLANDGALGLTMAVRSATSTDDPTYAWLDYEHKQKRALEDTRLLYVAATRAIKRLYLLFSINSEDEFKSPATNSLLSRIWTAVEAEVKWIDITAQQIDTPIASSTEIQSVKDSTLQRVPATWPIPVAAPLTANDSNIPRPMVATFETRVGSALHQLLEMLVTNGIERWQQYSIDVRATLIAQVLRQHGTGLNEMQQAVDVVTQALATMLADERGRWLLTNTHIESTVEWELLNGSGKRYVLDRSFVDDEGVRWIIDYKSSLPHAGEALDAFIRRESTMYSPQLQTYRELVNAFDSRPVRLALYFPRLAHFEEI